MMLIAQGESAENVTAPLEKVLRACEQCSDDLSSLSEQNEASGPATP